MRKAINFDLDERENVFMRSNDDVWYKNKIYTNRQYFANICKSIDRKVGRGTYSIEQLLDIIHPKKCIFTQHMKLNSNLPLDLIPYGRSRN